MFNEDLFLSTKSLVEDYSLLLAYMKKCKSKGVDCTHLIPSSRLLDELQKSIEKEPLSFDKVIELVRSKIEHTIICELCVEAFKEVYNIVVTCEDAKRMLLKQLAGWYIEILETLGYVRVKYSWRP